MALSDLRPDPGARLEARGDAPHDLPGAGARNLSVEVECGASLDVRRFAIDERMDELFSVHLEVLTPDAALPLDDLVGGAATFHLRQPARAQSGTRSFAGVCSRAELVAAEPKGLSTYQLTIVPTMWLLTQRTNHRIFQQQSDVEIARAVLSSWGVEHEVESAGPSKKRPYRVQHGETDYAFVCRMLEEAGVSFHFRVDEGGTTLVLSHDPQAGLRREGAVVYRDQPNPADRDFATNVRVARSARPGSYVLADHDTRLPPGRPLRAASSDGGPAEARLESFAFVPGAMLVEAPPQEGTPAADDRGASRSDERFAAALTESRLAAARGGSHTCTFETSAGDLGPGVVFAMSEHPHPGLDEDKPLLVVASRREGTSYGAWTHACEARPASLAYRPALDTPRPRVSGVESATVVGPAGEEIHTDEMGRVRVHFHWDRESGMDEKSSCWIPVSQPWSGAGYGGTNLPRVGQEVIVDFLGGDPDRPVIVGRVYTSHQTTPYKLPGNKTQSGWRSCSTRQTGGYNEIMFEDAAGRELVRMQAEKDLHKLVKHDEDVVIGRDRTKRVKRDDALQVDRDRKKRIDNDESVSVGHDRTERVENDETIAVGNDRCERVGNDEDVTIVGNRAATVQKNERQVVGVSRTRMVGVNEAVTVGVAQQLKVGAEQLIDVGGSRSVSVGRDQNTRIAKSHDVTVGRNQSTEVGKNQSVQVGKNQDLEVRGARSAKVAMADSEMIGLAKSVAVGAAYSLSVGGVMSTSVGKTQTETVGTTKTVTVGQKVTVTCGKASLTLDAAGQITWAIEGGATIVMKDKDIVLKSGGGGKIVLEGGPEVHLNPPE